MKSLLILIVFYMAMCNGVYAKTHDVQAKYEKEYNVELFTINLNNNSNILNVNENLLEFTTSLTNIDVVVIRVGADENKYVKEFTQQDVNYYLGFFKNGIKINYSDITIRIKCNNKILNIYDKLGNIVEFSDSVINLNDNNYFFTITDKLVEDYEYKFVNINTIVTELEEITEDSRVTIYDYKNNLINNNKILATGDKVLINNFGIITQYIIIVKGDTTGDAKINLNDITRLYHYYKKIEQMEEPFVLAGDVAKNDIINLNDITKIYHFYKNIISGL